MGLTGNDETHREIPLDGEGGRFHMNTAILLLRPSAAVLAILLLSATSFDLCRLDGFHMSLNKLAEFGNLRRGEFPGPTRRGGLVKSAGSIGHRNWAHVSQT